MRSKATKTQGPTGKQLTYEEFANLDKWEKTGTDGEIWNYIRDIGKYRISVWFSGNDLFWKWSGNIVQEDNGMIRRLARDFVYDRYGATAEEAFKEAYEMMSAEGVLVLGEGQS